MLLLEAEPPFSPGGVQLPPPPSSFPGWSSPGGAKRRSNRAVAVGCGAAVPGLYTCGKWPSGLSGTVKVGGVGHTFPCNRMLSTSCSEGALTSFLYLRSLPLKLSGQSVSLLPRPPPTHKSPPCLPHPQLKLPVPNGDGLPQLCSALHHQCVPVGKTPVQQLNKTASQYTIVNYKTMFATHATVVQPTLSLSFASVASASCSCLTSSVLVSHLLASLLSPLTTSLAHCSTASLSGCSTFNEDSLTSNTLCQHRDVRGQYKSRLTIFPFFPPSVPHSFVLVVEQSNLLTRH